MIKPIGSRILVLPNPPEETTESGLIIPKTAQERPQIGKVIDIGIGTEDDPMLVNIGDEVLYGKHSGIPVTFEDIEYLILRVLDILAVV